MVLPNNDDRIIKLKESISKQLSEIKKAKRFVPVTNCKLKLENVDYNIHTMNDQEVYMLLIKLDTMMTSASNIERVHNIDILDKFKPCGYTLSEWKGDAIGRLDYATIVSKKASLKVLEKKLQKLLTNEKRTELEIDIIENLIK